VLQLNVAADRLGQPLRLADGREVPAVRVDPEASAGGGAETEGEAIAALRRVGGILVNRDDRRAGRPVISVDFTSRRHVPPSAFRYLRAFPNLTSVALGGTDAGDEAVQLLEQVTHLEYLALDGTAITDDAIESLLRMSELKTVSLDETAVSPAAIVRLRRASPWLRVLSPKQPLPEETADDARTSPGPASAAPSDTPGPPLPNSREASDRRPTHEAGRVELRIVPNRGTPHLFSLEVRTRGLPAGIRPFYVWQFDDGPGQRTDSANLSHRFPQGGAHVVRVSVYYEDAEQRASLRFGEAEGRVVGQ
jgi:hypothetical protein